MSAIITITLLLIMARVALPYILINYAEKKINKITHYHATIEDIDVSLWRGGYTIKNIVLNKINNKDPILFFSAKRINLAVQWSALIHGDIVAKIEVFNPKLNFIVEPNNDNQQLTIGMELEQALKTLFPLKFNKMSVAQGEVTLNSFTAKPPFKLILHDLDFQIENMQRVKDTTSLYSSFSGHGIMNRGDFSFSGRVDPYAKKPTFLFKCALKSMQIEGANEFLMYFTHFDVQKGDFSLYAEIAAAQGKIHGYIKPLIKNLKVITPGTIHNPLQFLYKGVLAVTAKIVTNPKKHTIATKIKIDGEIKDPETHILSIIGYLFRNAFIQALLPQIDHSVKGII
jgi:hypothetical protein